MLTIKKTESFGEHIRTLREDARLTLKSVAEQINIDTSLLAKIERNERQPTKQRIIVQQFFCKIITINDIKNQTHENTKSSRQK